ncbi:hypothetical protein J2W25_000214 [Variovorax boronicumulans]|uniref:Uncharacterized protein n=1 Tax=Variovorax boronicumulans TaxID=436515 RepID=A0AAW8DPB0_9BURK|nr:hypothetical protein [Variovorax boronicumulans]MDP9875925.1 hypothetical protein [Variovorax boronicumulans]MDP9917154.1 hypothetical protein [Variovorax boronicumulans]MDP9921209.1 hypothetical protein [Variovorax boronicumulans]
MSDQRGENECKKNGVRSGVCRRGTLALIAVALIVVGPVLCGLWIGYRLYYGLGAIGGVRGVQVPDTYDGLLWAGMAAIAYGICLGVVAALNVKARWAAVAFVAAIALFQAWGIGNKRASEQFAAKRLMQDAVEIAPWEAAFELQTSKIRKAIDADDLGALSDAGKTCLSLYRTIPSHFQGRFRSGECRVEESPGDVAYTGLLGEAFKANAWRVMDHYLTQIEAQASASERPSWRGDSPDLEQPHCVVRLAQRDDLTPWLMPPIDLRRVEHLRAVGAEEEVQKPLQTEMLDVLAKHRAPPFRVGEEALQHLFVYALSQRRMDVAQAILERAKGRFKWCVGGMRATDLAAAVAPRTRGDPIWARGERAVFSAIAGWPEEKWQEAASDYLHAVKRTGQDDAASGKQSLAECQKVAGRIASTRPAKNRRALVASCAT